MKLYKPGEEPAGGAKHKQMVGFGAGAGAAAAAAAAAEGSSFSGGGGGTGGAGSSGGAWGGGGGGGGSSAQEGSGIGEPLFLRSTPFFLTCYCTWFVFLLVMWELCVSPPLLVLSASTLSSVLSLAIRASPCLSRALTCTGCILFAVVALVVKMTLDDLLGSGWRDEPEPTPQPPPAAAAASRPQSTSPPPSQPAYASPLPKVRAPPFTRFKSW